MLKQAERLAAALVVLADVQELLVGGDPARGVPPGALAKVLASSRAGDLTAAAEKLDAHAAAMEGLHIVQDATAKAMATATRDCAAIVRGMMGEGR